MCVYLCMYVCVYVCVCVCVCVCVWMCRLGGDEGRWEVGKVTEREVEKEGELPGEC